MVAAQNRLPRMMAWAIIAMGIVMFLGYLIYLPNPSLFDQANGQNNGLILYSLATAGAAFVAWGMMLGGLGESGISRDRMLLASTVGFAMLALMRLETALLPTYPFVQLRALPIVECVVFVALALRMYTLR